MLYQVAGRQAIRYLQEIVLCIGIVDFGCRIKRPHSGKMQGEKTLFMSFEYFSNIFFLFNRMYLAKTCFCKFVIRLLLTESMLNSADIVKCLKLASN